ncbi:hypothetical protein CIB48_g10077 [Xylaria polymorpha]|nr:hypothetical protein CIB48_g10077 [Xylaria polymorpha]
MLSSLISSALCMVITHVARRDGISSRCIGASKRHRLSRTLAFAKTGPGTTVHTRCSVTLVLVLYDAYVRLRVPRSRPADESVATCLSSQYLQYNMALRLNSPADDSLLVRPTAVFARANYDACWWGGKTPHTL